MTPEEMVKRGEAIIDAAADDGFEWSAGQRWLVAALLCERLDRIAGALEALANPPSPAIVFDDRVLVCDLCEHPFHEPGECETLSGPPWMRCRCG